VFWFPPSIHGFADGCDNNFGPSGSFWGHSFAGNGNWGGGSFARGWTEITFVSLFRLEVEIKGTGFTPTQNCTLWLYLPPKIFWSDRSLIWRNRSLQLMGPPSFVPLFLLVPIDYMDKTRMQCGWGGIRLTRCILVLSSRSPGSWDPRYIAPRPTATSHFPHQPWPQAVAAIPAPTDSFHPNTPSPLPFSILFDHLKPSDHQHQRCFCNNPALMLPSS
jgi:hypothetical protein